MARKRRSGPSLARGRPGSSGTGASSSASSGRGRGRSARPEFGTRFSGSAQAEPGRPEKRPVSASQSGEKTKLPPAKLAEIAKQIALEVETSVLVDGRRADRSLAYHFKRRDRLALGDRILIGECVDALFRWRGWVEPLTREDPIKRLLFCHLCDLDKPHAVDRVWAREIGIEPARLTGLGDAPDWTARAEMLKQLLNQNAINADPWQLVPEWFRESLPMPPGDGSTKLRRLQVLARLQAKPRVWIRARKGQPEALWSHLSDRDLSVVAHDYLQDAAYLKGPGNLTGLSAYRQGQYEIQDLAAQTVALACDPEPGERWWVVGVSGGQIATHLADELLGKGQVIASDAQPGALKGVTLRARRLGLSNLATRTWDGRRVVGKPGSYHGVLVEPMSSGVGTWRRQPSARWTLTKANLQQIEENQRRALHTAIAGLKPGGLLIYTVATLRHAETRAQIDHLLEEHPELQLDPFPDPLIKRITDGTLTVWPHLHDCETRFIARMIRTGKSS